MFMDMGWYDWLTGWMAGWLASCKRCCKKVCSHYESNAHWKQINSHCLRSHWMHINCNSYWMCFGLIHLHRCFEGKLHHQGNYWGVIYSRVIDCIRKRAIRKEITSITLLFRLGKVLYLAAAQGLKRGLVVSKRLIEAHIWLIVNLIRASWNNS